MPSWESWDEEKDEEDDEEGQREPCSDDDDSDDDPWYEGAAYLVYKAQCCEEYTRNRAAKVWLRLLCRMWRCAARTVCLRPMKLLCPNNRKTAELEQYLTAFLLLLIGLLVLYLMVGGHKPDMDIAFADLGGVAGVRPGDHHLLQREAQLERERQMMSDLENGQVVKAHMDVPRRPGAALPAAGDDARRNPDDDIFDPIKVGKLPRILGAAGGGGGNKKQLDYGNDDTDLHGFVGPERVYFYNHEEEPLVREDVLKARKEMKILRKIEDDDKNEDSLKPDEVDEPGFHGFVGPDTVIEYEHEDRFVGRKRKKRLQRAKEEFLNIHNKAAGRADSAVAAHGAGADRTGRRRRRRRSLPPPSRSLQSAPNPAAGVAPLEIIPTGSRARCEPCRMYNLSAPLEAEYECISLNVKPNTPVCLYDNDKDIHISRTLRRDGIWEPHIVKELQNILFQDPDVHLIDIGANIGMYSLIAARLGRRVVAVEPFIENIRRLHKAAQMAGVADRITLLQNAVSDRRATVRLHLEPRNQGGVAIETGANRKSCVGSACAPKVATITMDDLRAHVPFNKCVIKIDIEGHEHRALRHMAGLMRAVYVPYILMEWHKLRGYFGSKVTESEDKALTWRLVRFLTDRGYTASSLVTGSRLDTSYWYGWPDDIIWKNELQELL